MDRAGDGIPPFPKPQRQAVRLNTGRPSTVIVAELILRTAALSETFPSILIHEIPFFGSRLRSDCRGALQYLYPCSAHRRQPDAGE